MLFFTPPISVDLLRRMAGRLFRQMARNRLRYVAGFYGFSATPPFQPVLFTPAPVLVSEPDLPRRCLPPLDSRVRDIVYPSGAVWTEGKWIVAFGVGNEFCCIKTLAHHDLLNVSSRITQ